MQSTVLLALAALAASAVVVPVAPVAAPQVNFTKCLAQNCVAQVKACANDKTCMGGIKVRALK